MTARTRLPCGSQTAGRGRWSACEARMPLPLRQRRSGRPVPVDRSGVGQQRPHLCAARGAGVQDAHPSLRRVRRVRKHPVQGGVVDVCVMFCVRRAGSRAAPRSSRGHGNVEAKNVVTVQIGGGVEAGVVLDDDGGEGEPPAWLTVTVTTPGKPAMNSIRSSCVIWPSIPGNHRGLPVTHQPPATMALGGGGKRSVL